MNIFSFAEIGCLIGLTLLAGVGGGRAFSHREDVDIASLAPAPPDGWRLDGDDARYDKETIFNYMDGAGEVYLSFDFRGMFVRQYAHDGEEGITLEIYDMGSPAEAYGIFSRNREGEDTGIGNGSEFRSGYCVFWKGRWFITVYTLRESERSNATVLALAREIAGRISDAGAPPTLLSALPTQNLDARTIRYFHKYTDLNQHYFIADDNILGLGPACEAAFATYDLVGRRTFLLIVKYPDTAQSAAAYAALLSHFMPGGADSAEIEPGYWAVARRQGQYLTAVLDAASADQARGLLARLNLSEEK